MFILKKNKKNKKYIYLYCHSLRQQSCLILISSPSVFVFQKQNSTGASCTRSFRRAIRMVDAENAKRIRATDFYVTHSSWIFMLGKGMFLFYFTYLVFFCFFFCWHIFLTHQYYAVISCVILLKWIIHGRLRKDTWIDPDSALKYYRRMFVVVLLEVILLGSIDGRAWLGTPMWNWICNALGARINGEQKKSYIPHIRTFTHNNMILKHAYIYRNIYKRNIYRNFLLIDTYHISLPFRLRNDFRNRHVRSGSYQSWCRICY